MTPKRKHTTLVGKNNRMGEKSAPIFKIIIKKRRPSFSNFILLLPSRLPAFIGIYATGKAERKNAIVEVVGYEKPLGRRYKNFLKCFARTARKPDVRSSIFWPVIKEASLLNTALPNCLFLDA